MPNTNIYARVSPDKKAAKGINAPYQKERLEALIEGIAALLIFIVFIFTQLSSFKNELDKKTSESNINFNPIKQVRQTELTYETLKQYKGFENISEAEAPKQIETIKRLAKVLYYLYLNEQQTTNI